MHGHGCWGSRSQLASALDEDVEKLRPVVLEHLLEELDLDEVGALVEHELSGIAAVKLPSTSPANAACRPETLQKVWGEALREWLL